MPSIGNEAALWCGRAALLSLALLGGCRPAASAQPASIDTQPGDLTVHAGESAAFSVAAAGAAPLAYHWQREESGSATFADVPAADSSTLAFTAVAADDGARFHVRVSNGAGAVVSSEAKLTVTVPPAITAQPQDQSVMAGASASFSVAATGTGPLTWQWQGAESGSADFVDLPVSTASAYTLVTTPADEGARFRVRVSNGAGEVFSGEATLTVMVRAPRLSLSASRPAGTLEDLPLLSWALQGPAGLSLVLRAQAPGASAPGVGFAGVPVASGPFRYLDANGQWSETEVAYAAAAGTAGTIQPTAPLRVEGEWRFDLLAKDSAGELQAMGVAPVVLSAKPALRVTLGQRAAVDGDAVEGSVVLARGGTATPVKLLAWWQGPDGTAVKLPEGAPLAFDGPSADVRLPLLVKRLDGPVPGPWSLVARLFDAGTGAPLAYGEQSLQVCGSTPPLGGKVRGSDGSPLGSGASVAEVSALSIDRQAQVSAAVGAAGDFSLALDPGAWVVSALVLDDAGMHRVPEQWVQLGCAAAPPLVLDAAPPVTMPARPGRPTAALAGLAPPPLAGAEAARSTVPAEQVQIPIFAGERNGASAIIGAGGLTRAMELIRLRTLTETSSGISINTVGSLTGAAKSAWFQQAVGADSTAADQRLRDMVGQPLAAFISIDKVSNTELMLTLVYVDARQETTTLRRIQRNHVTAATFDETVVGMAREAAGGSPSLLALTQAVAGFPQNPRLTLTASFGSVLPSSQQTVKVHLESATHNVYANRTLSLERQPIPFPSEATAATDANGDATFSVLLGVADREESIRAVYINNVHKSFSSDDYHYAIQRGQTGQLQFAATVPVVHPGGSAVLQATSRDPVTGTPQPAQPIVFSADLGGAHPTATATTDSSGSASVTLPSGTGVGLGHVNAIASTQSPPPQDAASASENVVVSSPVALNFPGPPGTVLPGSQVQLPGSLQLDGLPMPGSTVTLASTGGGTLSTPTATVDASGGFSATFQPPASGTGSANVTVSVSVEGQEVTQSSVVSWGGDVRGDRLIFTATSDTPPIYRVFRVDPQATTEVFAASPPAGSGGSPFYLREQQKLVVSVGSGLPNSSGWGLLDAAGTLETVSAGTADHTDLPLTVSANGKYHLHQAGIHSCTGGSEGTCSTAYTARVYDSATNAQLEEFAPEVSAGATVDYSNAGIGPAGEVLYSEYTGALTVAYRLHRLGGGTTAVGDYPGGLHGAFVPGSDKIYISAGHDVFEHDLGTGANRTLPLTPNGINGSWTVELGGILWFDRNETTTPLRLHRLDLVTGQVTDVGAVPASNYWLLLVP